MRLVEIDQRLADQMLLEGLADSIKKMVGDKVNTVVNVVNNMQSAMIVIYRVCTNPQYLSTITAMILKSVRQKLKALKDNPIFDGLVKGIYGMMPTEAQSGLDFIKSLIMIGLVNAATLMLGKLKDFAKDTIGDSVTEFIQNAAKKIFSLDGMLSQLADVTGLMKIIQGLGIANEIIFSSLDYANRKIESIPVGLGAQYRRN
jgi:hypothetical protein